jgi:hypothetical protein
LANWLFAENHSPLDGELQIYLERLLDAVPAT